MRLPTLAAVALVAVSVVLHQPVSAQDASEQAVYSPLTAHDARLCLMLFAYVDGSTEDESPAAQKFSDGAMAYFAGFTEGASGGSFAEGDLVADLTEMRARSLELPRLCVSHVQQFGQRWSAWGEELLRQVENSAPPPSPDADD